MTKFVLKYGILSFVRAFFPIQLIFGHLKYNLLPLFFWVLLFSIASDNFGSAFGIPFLLYSPEYQGETGFISFLLIGFAFGGFTMAFHTYSYMKLGKRYPFIATVSKPFIKFCLNNSLIPLIFMSVYLSNVWSFQIDEEFATVGQSCFYLFSFLCGFILFLIISFFYFFPRNRHLLHKLGLKPFEDKDAEPISSFFHKKIDWQNYFKYRKDRTYLYLINPFKWRASRTSEHYDKESLDKVFRQSKISSTLFEFVTILVFFTIGIFREHPVLDLPAGMSIIMLLTILMMMISAMTSWLYYWTYPVIILLLLIMNDLSKHTTLFQFKNYAYGMSYEKKDLVDYNLTHLNDLASNQIFYNRSKRNYLLTLKKWKYRTKVEKPKLVIIMTSGGGSRSAMWTFQVMQHLDQNLNYELSKHTQLITGASGGMVGAAFYRSLYLKKLLGENIRMGSVRYNKQISQDLLNKLSFSAYSNDLFFRVQNFNLNGHSYTKDRGYSFENQLNENTKGVLNESFNYFGQYEKSAAIPTMIFSPTIVNDGRRLLMSGQSLAFMCSNKKASGNLTNMYENIDFQSLFSDNNDVRFLSVLRMSATFPLVLPMVSMPTNPEMHVMDAGIRDNYGGKVTMEYLFALQDWIGENTSGVILLKIRDTKKILKGETVHKVSLLNKFSLPFGNMYDNFPRTQDFDQDELLKISAQGFKFPIDLVIFNLRESKKDRISLSWHLTAQEKLKIERALKSEGNKNAMQQMKLLLK